MSLNVSNENKTPYMLWGQNDTHIFLSIKVDTPKNVELTFNSQNLILETDSYDSHYSLNLPLKNEVIVEDCQYNSKPQKIECILKKKETELWNNLTINQQYKHYIKIDWDKWTELNDEEEVDTSNPGGMDMDFSKFMSQMSPEMMSGMSPEMMSGMSPEMMSGMSPEMMSQDLNENEIELENNEVSNEDNKLDDITSELENTEVSNTITSKLEESDLNEIEQHLND